MDSFLQIRTVWGCPGGLAAGYNVNDFSQCESGQGQVVQGRGFHVERKEKAAAEAGRNDGNVKFTVLI